MASLPFTFTVPYGYVAVYGEFENSLSGMVPGDRDFVFGYIYQIGQNVTNVYNDDYVLYNKKEVEVRLIWDNVPYQQIEAAKLAGIDTPPVTPP